jgi:hypothetical protein
VPDLPPGPGGEDIPAALGDRVAELERRLGKDSGTSSRPPSSDNPDKKKPRDRSLRGRSGRNRGQQPGAESSTLRQVADPDEIVVCAPVTCGRCAASSSQPDRASRPPLHRHNSRLNSYDCSIEPHYLLYSSLIPLITAVGHASANGRALYTSPARMSGGYPLLPSGDSLKLSIA